MASRLSSAVAALVLGIGLGGCGSAASPEPEVIDNSTMPPYYDANGVLHGSAPADPASAAPAPSDPASAAPAPTDTTNSQVQIVVLFENMDDGGVRNGVTKAATLKLDAAATITYVQTYHWNNGKGVAPETIMITGPDGTIYGPWQAKGTDGQGGVRNAYWEVEPNVALAAGTYLVEDSSPKTRSTNDAMGGIGQTVVRGFYEE